MLSKDTDVIVMGAGLAGNSYGSRTGAKVCIVSSSKLDQGSSFYPGTWGLAYWTREQEDEETY